MIGLVVEAREDSEVVSVVVGPKAVQRIVGILQRLLSLFQILQMSPLCLTCFRLLLLLDLRFALSFKERRLSLDITYRCAFEILNSQ